MNLTDRIKIRLRVYSELIGKSEEEALYFALGIAKAFYEMQKKYQEIADVKIPVIKSPYTDAMKLRQERYREMHANYYRKNKIKINQRRRELRQLKKEKENLV